ncbi:stalk domain-containing protein [Paenibacillus chitinolyticus]
MRKSWAAAGMTAALLVGITAGAYATSNLKEIKAFLNPDLQVDLNGSTFTLKDEQGNDLVPITYEGNTYLPLRDLAQRLDLSVTWDGTNNKVVLNNKPYVEFSAEDEALLEKYGYGFRFPRWLENMVASVIPEENVKTSIEEGRLDKRAQALTLIHYMVQDENLHRLHDVVARIEVYKKEDWPEVKKTAAGAEVLGENDRYVYIAKKAAENPYEPGTLDAEGFGDLRDWLDLHDYYFTLSGK